MPIGFARALPASLALSCSVLAAPASASPSNAASLVVESEVFGLPYETLPTPGDPFRLTYRIANQGPPLETAHATRVLLHRGSVEGPATVLFEAAVAELERGAWQEFVAPCVVPPGTEHGIWNLSFTVESTGDDAALEDVLSVPLVVAKNAHHVLVDLRTRVDGRAGQLLYENIDNPQQVYGGLALPIDCSLADDFHFGTHAELFGFEFVYLSLFGSCCSAPTFHVYKNDPENSVYPCGFEEMRLPPRLASFQVPGLQTSPTKALRVTVLTDPTPVPRHFWFEGGFAKGDGPSGAIAQNDLAGETASGDFLVYNCPVLEVRHHYWDTDNPLNNLAVNLFGVRGSAPRDGD